MITVIIQGTKDIHNTLRSLENNASGIFRVLVDESVREELSRIYKMEFVKPGIFLKYGPKSELYWLLTSGCLVLTASWDVRMELCVRKGLYCLHPGGQEKFSATNVQRNVGKWRGNRYIVPILRVTES